jgi:pimeloyl-ACP methyl ester carboxylesterase
MNRSGLAAILIALSTVLAGCSGPPPLAVDSKAAHLAVTPLRTYWPIQSWFLMKLAGLKGISASEAIDCYRVTYPSTDEKGRAIELSGLLALPRGKAALGVVSFQHGTTSDRDFVPSNLSTDGLAAAILFAGNGYATLAPDYIGLGVSKRPHPYYVASDTARAVVDLIHAIRHVRGVPRSAPFLMGFSEGGFASLAAQRAMEAAGESVLGDAAVAGAFNLRLISIPWTLEGRSANASTYLALWVRGYATRYGQPLDTAFTPRYAALVPKLFDTPHDSDAVVKALPRDPRALFKPTVLRALSGKGNHWLAEALKENEMGDWTARAPIRLYYGSRDVDVPPAEAIATRRQMAARGSPIQATRVGDLDHESSVLAAAPSILGWLQSFRTASGTK